MKNQMSAKYFVTIGYLIPSNTGRTYKVIVNGCFCGLVKTTDLINVKTRPMQKIPISIFVGDSKQKIANGIRIADLEKLEEVFKT